MSEQQIRGWLSRATRLLMDGGWAGTGLVGVSSVALSLLTSCGGSEEPVQYPQQQPQQQTAPVQPVATAAPAPAPDPAATTVQPLSPADEVALKAAIEARAATEARGMKPAGAFFGGVSPAGGQVESPQVMIDLGKCYSVIAQGGMGVTELDIQIQAVMVLPFIQNPTVAVDNSTGNMASISPCWTNSYPAGFPGKVVLKATSGSGPVGAMLYVK